MYTAQKINNMAIALIDEISDTGTIDANKTKEYSARAPYLLDMWQKEMAKSGDFFKTFELSCFRKINLLGDLDSFTAVEHKDTDLTYEADGANCFYFGVDSAADVYIEQLSNGSWVSVSGTYIDEQNKVPTAFTGLISANTSTASFNYYKGIITATGKVRIRFSGNYYYRQNCRALCPYKFISASKVPDFKAWYKIDLPADFKSRTQVVNEYTMWQYEQDTQAKWEGKEFYIQFGYEGIIRIKYIPIPVEITSLTQTLEVDDITAMSGAYYLAEHFALADQNDEIARVCRSKFKELKVDSFMKTPLSNTEIVDVYGIGGA